MWGLEFLPPSYRSPLGFIFLNSAFAELWGSLEGACIVSTPGTLCHSHRDAQPNSLCCPSWELWALESGL